jgi:hypothetical protein
MRVDTPTERTESPHLEPNHDGPDRMRTYGRTEPYSHGRTGIPSRTAGRG